MSFWDFLVRILQITAMLDWEISGDGKLETLQPQQSNFEREEPASHQSSGQQGTHQVNIKILSYRNDNIKILSFVMRI